MFYGLGLLIDYYLVMRTGWLATEGRGSSGEEKFLLGLNAVVARWHGGFARAWRSRHGPEEFNGRQELRELRKVVLQYIECVRQSLTLRRCWCLMRSQTYDVPVPGIPYLMLDLAVAVDLNTSSTPTRSKRPLRTPTRRS